VAIVSLNQTTEINQHLNQNKPNSGTEAVDHDLACAPSEVLRALNLSSVPIKSTVNISKEEAEKRHAIDERIWKIGFTDIFRPVTLFNKIFNKILYPFQKAHRSDFDPEFRNIVKAGIPLEKHLIKTSDNHSIELWFARNPNPEARTRTYLHGNSSNITNFKQEAIEDYKNGNNICLFSYRGYSGNHGYPSQEGLIDDTSSVIDFLKHRQNIDTQTMDFDAHSLGCAVLLNTLAQRVSRHNSERYGDLLLMSPFKNMRAVAESKYMPKFLSYFIRDSWNNFKAITKLTGKIGKVKFLHGKIDKVIPYQHSQELHQQASNNSLSSELVELENIGHNDIKRGMKS
jgi:pimeloyl-ACP methyl ester carboxylesterase